MGLGSNKVKIIDAIQHKGNPFWIPECTRSDIPEFLVQKGFKKGVEIGVSWAENIIDYCEAGLEIYGIDPWKDSEDNLYRRIVSIEGKHSKTIDDVYNLAVSRTSKYPNCKLIRKTSMEALEDFPERSLDFVYIDGNHNFGYIAMDLMKWVNKIKKGGVIAGHDYYSTYGDRRVRFVGYIVDAFAKAYDFTNFYVLGTKDSKRLDKNFSYMFFKHW